MTIIAWAFNVLLVINQFSRLNLIVIAIEDSPDINEGKFFGHNCRHNSDIYSSNFVNEKITNDIYRNFAVT